MIKLKFEFLFCDGLKVKGRGVRVAVLQFEKVIFPSSFDFGQAV